MDDNKYIGSECGTCGNTLRYKASRNCVACMAKKNINKPIEIRECTQCGIPFKTRARRRCEFCTKGKTRSYITIPSSEWHLLKDIDRSKMKAFCSGCEAVVELTTHGDKVKCKVGAHYATQRARQSNMSATYEELEEAKAKATHCIICGKEFATRQEKHADHNHETGAFRNILCKSCNVGLGYFKDNPQVLMNASMYLIKHKA